MNSIDAVQFPKARNTVRMSSFLLWHCQKKLNLQTCSQAVSFTRINYIPL